MKQHPSKFSAAPFDLEQWLRRGRVLGNRTHRPTFADVDCLRIIRSRRLYKSRCARWSDFCVRYAGASRSRVDRLIHCLLEFGPQYFELNQITRVSPRAYRAIASNVSDRGVWLGQEYIPTIEENARRLSAAVAELRRCAALPPVPVGHQFGYAVAAVTFEQLIAAVGELEALSPAEKREMEDLQLDLDQILFRLTRDPQD